MPEDKGIGNGKLSLDLLVHGTNEGLVHCEGVTHTHIIAIGGNPMKQLTVPRTGGGVSQHHILGVGCHSPTYWWGWGVTAPHTGGGVSQHHVLGVGCHSTMYWGWGVTAPHTGGGVSQHHVLGVGCHSPTYWGWGVTAPHTGGGCHSPTYWGWGVTVLFTCHALLC